MVERMLILSQRPEQNLIEEVALVKGINPSFVEKDWWVVQLVRINNSGQKVLSFFVEVNGDR